MEGTDDGILRLRMTDIDPGLMEAGEDLTLNIRDTVRLKLRAERFRDWLTGAIPNELKEYVCFVDYTVFQDAKIQNPYFYLVSPTSETKHQYQNAVDLLLKGTDGEQDCFSVAYHPEFVGIRESTLPNSLAIIPVRDRADEPAVVATASRVVEESDWVPDYYHFWKDDSRWPPTTKDVLNRICGRHTLGECLARFQSILEEMRQGICDSSGRPVTFVYCLPFLISSRSSQNSRSSLPFSEIAAALFLGMSFERSEKQSIAVMEFVRSLALWTYRIAGIQKGEATGQSEGLGDAIESFAHQIKGVANAMSTKWSVKLDRWEEIQNYFQDDPVAINHLKTARVLPAPQLIEAIRETLILWSQTRRIDDLFEPRPVCFRDVINRAWEFTSRIRFALENVSRNLGESAFDLTKVWGQDGLLAQPEITGDVNTAWGDWGKVDLDTEGRLCSVTRLLVAIFDNLSEHGLPSERPKVSVTANTEAKTLSLKVSNTVGNRVVSSNSRLRIGMKGNQVLQFLADQLEAELTLPTPTPGKGADYLVTVEIPSLGVLFPVNPD